MHCDLHILERSRPNPNWLPWLRRENIPYGSGCVTAFRPPQPSKTLPPPGSCNESARVPPPACYREQGAPCLGEAPCRPQTGCLADAAGGAPKAPSFFSSSSERGVSLEVRTLRGIPKWAPGGDFKTLRGKLMRNQKLKNESQFFCFTASGLL